MVDTSPPSFTYPEWLTAPETPILGTERVGRHVLWTLVGGQFVRHQDWTATHEGQCPKECRPYRQPEPTKVPDTERLRRMTGKRGGKPKKPRRPAVARMPLKPLAMDGGY